MIARRSVVGWALALALAAPSAASAQNVRLRDSPCPAQLPRRALSRLLSVELRGDGVSAVAETRRFDARTVADVELVSDCAEPLQVRVRVTHPAGRGAEERAVDLTGVPPLLRVRLLALTTAELLRASWSEIHAAPPAPAVLPALPTQPEVAPARAAVRVHSANRLAVPSAPARPRPRAPAPDGDEEDDEPPEDAVVALPAPERELAAALGDPASGASPVIDAAPYDVAAGAGVRLFPSTGLVLVTAAASVRVPASPDAFVAFDVGAGADASGAQGALVAVPVGVRFGVSVDAAPVRVDVGPRLEAALLWVADVSSSTGNERVAADARITGLAAASLSVELAAELTPDTTLGLLGDVGWVLVELPSVASGPTASLALFARLR